MKKLHEIRVFLKFVWQKTGYYPPKEDRRISWSTAWYVAKTVCK